MKHVDYRRTCDATTYNSEDELYGCLRQILEGHINPPKIFYTRKEVSNILRCGKTKTFDLIRRNQLEKVKLDSRTLITKASVDALIAKLKQEAGHAA